MRMCDMDDIVSCHKVTEGWATDEAFQSVFCGKEELLLVQNLTFLTF